MPLFRSKIDREYEAFLSRECDQGEIVPPVKRACKRSIPAAIAGWWMITAIAATVVSVVFNPPGFAPMAFLLAVVTMPVAVICAVVASDTRKVRAGLGAHHLPRI